MKRGALFALELHGFSMYAAEILSKQKIENYSKNYQCYEVTFRQLGCGTKSRLVQSISLGSNETPPEPVSSGSTTSSGSSVVLGGATVVEVVVVVALVVVVVLGFLGFFVVDLLVVLDTAGTGADVGLIGDDDGFGFGFGLRVVVGSTTSPSSGFGGVAGGFAHSGCKYTHTHTHTNRPRANAH